MCVCVYVWNHIKLTHKVTTTKIQFICRKIYIHFLISRIYLHSASYQRALSVQSVTSIPERGQTIET